MRGRQALSYLLVAWLGGVGCAAQDVREARAPAVATPPSSEARPVPSSQRVTLWLAGRAGLSLSLEQKERGAQRTWHWATLCDAPCTEQVRAKRPLQIRLPDGETEPFTIDETGTYRVRMRSGSRSALAGGIVLTSAGGLLLGYAALLVGVPAAEHSPDQRPVVAVTALIGAALATVGIVFLAQGRGGVDVEAVSSPAE